MPVLREGERFLPVDWNGKVIYKVGIYLRYRYKYML